MTIRKIRTSETALLRDLAERTFREAWQDDNEPKAFEAYCRDNFTLEKLGAELAAPDAEFYFAWAGDRPAAYLKLNINKLPIEFENSPGDFESPGEYQSGQALQIERIYVLQDFQGQGYGEQLLQLAEARARDTGARWLWLSVWQRAPRSIKFYEKNGFSIFGVETYWVGDDPQPDWLMRKQMSTT